MFFFDPIASPYWVDKIWLFCYDQIDKEGKMVENTIKYFKNNQECDKDGNYLTLAKKAIDSGNCIVLDSVSTPRKCVCSSRDLFNFGCKCGSFSELG